MMVDMKRTNKLPENDEHSTYIISSCDKKFIDL